jgi:hypothetical protein
MSKPKARWFSQGDLEVMTIDRFIQNCSMRRRAIRQWEMQLRVSHNNRALLEKIRRAIRHAEERD